MSGLRGSGAARLRVVRQLEVGDCGAACLAMVLGARGAPVDLERLRELTGTGRTGVTAAGLVAAARSLGLQASGVRCAPDRVADLPPGSILHWGGNHFVVLGHRRRSGVELLDPARGRRIAGPDQLRESFSGTALVFTGDLADTHQQVPHASARLRRYRPFLSGAGRPALLALGCAVLVQLFALANPFVLRYVVERLTAPGARPPATALALGVLALAAGYLAAVVGRVGFLVALQRAVDYRLTLGTLEHLVAQPFAFLARRSEGDLALRLRSTVIVRQVLTSGALSTLLDGALVLGYVVLIAITDLWFGLLTSAAIAVQVLVVALAWHRLARASADALDAQTRSQAELVEMLGAMELLKASGAGRQVVGAWSARLRAEVDAQARRSRLGGIVDGTLLAVRFTAPPLLLVLGLDRVSSGALGLPDMLALAALAAAVTVPTGGLLSTVCSLTTVASYVERLDDLLRARPERRGGLRVDGQLRGAVTLTDVTFAYSPLAPPAVQDVTLQIDPGEHVAVVGASGSGKTTLAMLVATLHEPQAGVVAVDGVEVADYDLEDLRAHIGVVTQDAPLFAMSVFDNIVLGRPGISEQDVVAAARIACVHEEVLALPGGYAAVLGNRGSGISGGQRQRIALARALVTRPGLLILDEATSALDAATEEAVHRALADVECTRIVIAHRLSTVARADRLVVMEAGRVVADGRPAQVRRSSAEFRRLAGTDDDRAARPPRQRRSGRPARGGDRADSAR